MDSAMTSTITMDAAGRVALPAQIRERLQLRAGSKLRLAIVAERLELTPSPRQPPGPRAKTDASYFPQPANPLMLRPGSAPNASNKRAA